MNKNILIAEDEKPMATALELKLKKSGFNARAVCNGQEAIYILSKEKYDLLLLDLMMPKMDGITMLKELRKKYWGKNIPVIILTNLSDGTKIAESMTQGTFDYLIKSNWKIEDITKLVKEKLK